MNKSQCPSQADLADYVSDRLSEENRHVVESHLSTCPLCAETVTQRSATAAHHPPDDGLNATVAYGGSRPDSTMRLKQVVPGYELKALIGEGGMGVVYSARDVELDREVAVKLIGERCAGDPRLVGRFTAEARITGQLEHPGVPALHELGRLESGQPFLAMKLVRGETLANRLPTDPAGLVDRRGELLGIFEQVCQAVGYAHSKHIIHRDLKPENIMVGAFGEVQVMDWGLAKQIGVSDNARAAVPLDAARHPQATAGMTEAGVVMGTPAYMPPEQARGELDAIDARSDVFALGAILLRLLTGRTPYQAKDANEARRRAAEGDLSAAIHSLDACGAEPDVVELCRRCLAPAAGQRPENAAVVAARLGAIRRNAEQRAREAEMERAALVVRESEARRRRRLVNVAVTAVIGVLVLGIAGTTWGLLAAREQTRRAVSAANLEKAAKEKEALAKQVAEHRLDQVVYSNQVIRGIFADLDIDAVKQGVDPLETVLAKRLFAAGEQLNADALGDPEEAARLQFELAASLMSLSFPQEAKALAEQALATLQQQANVDQQLLASVQAALARALSESGALTEAADLLEVHLPKWESRLGSTHPTTLGAMQTLGALYGAMTRPADAGRVYESLLERAKQSLGEEDLETLKYTIGYANILRNAGNPQRSLQLLEEAVPRLRASGSDSRPYVLNAMNALSSAYGDVGRQHAAMLVGEEALRLCEQHLDREHVITLEATGNLAVAYDRLGQRDLARPLSEGLPERFARRLGEDHFRTVISEANHAMLLARAILESEGDGSAMRQFDLRQDASDTLQVVCDARDRSLAVLGGENPVTKLASLVLALTCYRVGEHELAAETLESVKDFPGLYQSDHVFLVESYAASGRFAEGADLVRRDLAYARSALPPGSSQFVRRLLQNGERMMLLHAFDEAEACLRECLSIRERSEPNTWKFHNAQCVLAEILLRRLATLPLDAAAERDAQLEEAGQLLETGLQGLLARRHMLTGPDYFDRPSRFAASLAEYQAASGDPDSASASEMQAKAFAEHGRVHGRAATISELRRLLAEASQVSEEVQAAVVNQVEGTRGRLEELVASLEERLRESPNAGDYTNQAGLLARLRDWSRAADREIAAARLLPPARGRLNWARAAVYRYFQGDLDGYREVCRDLAKAMQGTADPALAEIVAQANLIHPATTADLTKMMEVVEGALAAADPAWFYNWGSRTLALYEYRRGNWDQAIAWTERTNQDLRQPWATSLLIRAMAFSRLGRSSEAAECLARAEALIPKELSTISNDANGTRDAIPVVALMNNDLHAEILRREARALLQGKSSEQHAEEWFSAQPASQ